MMADAVALLLQGFTLEPPHPFAGRDAWQCVTCDGIWYPPETPPAECPYCTEDAA